MFTKRYCFLSAFIICCLVLHAQEFTPIVKQFVKKDYNAANQNWAVGQTSDGVFKKKIKPLEILMIKNEKKSLK